MREIIYKRKSVRKYTAEKISEPLLQKINGFLRTVKPLYENIAVRMEILPRDKIHSLFSWTPPQALALYSEEKQGYLENAGFILQQAELYLQSLGLGACWLGLGKPNQGAKEGPMDGLKYVIMVAFGYPSEEQFRGSDGFKRKSLYEISEQKDERLEAARLAPSSMNTQSWYFTHEKDVLHVYKRTQTLLKPFPIGKLNQIDVGLALAHLYVENPQTFTFFITENHMPLKGMEYEGSIHL